MYLAPEVFHASCLHTFHISLGVHHALDSRRVVIRSLGIIYLLQAVHTRIVVFFCLKILVHAVANPLVHLLVVFLQVDRAVSQLVTKVFPLGIPLLLQYLCILHGLLVCPQLGNIVTHKEHPVALQSVLGNHIEVEVPYLLLVLLSVEGIQYVSHCLVERLHHVALKHLRRIAHRSLHGVLQHIGILRRFHVLYLLDGRVNRLHQFLQREHIVHEALRSHIAVGVQGTVVAVECSAGRRSGAEMHLTVGHLLILSLGQFAHVVIDTPCVVMEHTASLSHSRNILVVDVVFHSLCPHLIIRVVRVLLQILAQPKQILHVLGVGCDTIAYLVQEVSHLVLDVSPEACIASSFLGKTCHTFLNGIAIVEGILLHLFHHQLLQGGILGLVEVVPHAVQELVEPVLTKQLPHSLVSYHLVPDGLLGSIAVVDIGHIEMHLAGLLVIPASDFLAFPDCFLRLRIGHFLGRLHHVHLAAHLLGYAGDMLHYDRGVVGELDGRISKAILLNLIHGNIINGLIEVIHNVVDSLVHLVLVGNLE